MKQQLLPDFKWVPSDLTVGGGGEALKLGATTGTLGKFAASDSLYLPGRTDTWFFFVQIRD